ncbi:hypothetical protein [Microtetraspora niveoalba]|uniref:hypothetical protein n=1 Tax=Microtetraspora niveoalba TaxID=46175 RepID=UPI000AB83BCA|nr:hypothetical protein [Microtetraspora niveoalba]
MITRITARSAARASGLRGFPSTIGFAMPTGLHVPVPTRAAERLRTRAGGLLARHRAVAVVLAFAAALRVVTMLGYPPARLYWYDSFTYLDNAVHLLPSATFHPIGYPLLLRALLPFHSVTVVVAVQHAMGLATGLTVYAVARRRGLPSWGAVLAAAPVLFDASFLRLEHAVLSDTLFTLLVVSAVAVLTWRERPSTRAGLAAGLLLAGAALTRTIALPLLLLVLLVLALRRVSWRALAALALAGTLPLAGYAAWYGAVHGKVALSGADGVALWARTMTFADCAVIAPPPELAPLCPNGAVQDAASEYVWDAEASINLLPGGRFAHNERARDFALRAIAAQPLDYLRDVLADTSIAFHWTPVAHPARTVPAFGFARGIWPLPDQPLVAEVRGTYASDVAAMRSAGPWADVLIAYQRLAYLRGPVLAAILLTGALGAVLRPGRAALPWAVAMGLLVGPVAVLDFDHRYVLPVVPVACLAAALAVRRSGAGGGEGGGDRAQSART